MRSLDNPTLDCPPILINREDWIGFDIVSSGNEIQDFDDSGRKAVSARELYDFLGV